MCDSEFERLIVVKLLSMTEPNWYMNITEGC